MNYSPRTLLAALALLLAAPAVPDTHAQESNTTAAPADTSALVEQARAVAADWLALIDAGDYARSWEEATSTLHEQISQEQISQEQISQEQISQEQWANRVNRLQKSLGAFQERSLDTASYHTPQTPQAADLPS